MIKGKVQENYRELKGLNYSSIKTFDNEGPSIFYDQFVLGKPKKEPKDNTGLIIGSLVDDIIVTCKGDMHEFEQMFDTKYSLLDSNKSTSQAFLLADKLFEITMRDTVDGVVRTELLARFTEAFEAVQKEDKYKGKTVDQAFKDFNDKAKDYFDTKMSNIGKQVIDMLHLNKARFVAEQLMYDDFTRGIFSSSNWMPKIVVEFDYMGISCKCEIDGIEVNHDNKTVQRYDLKCLYDNEGFPYAYIKNSYYLQDGFYYLGIKKWLADNGLQGYTILPMKFIVADTSMNSRRPLIYNSDISDTLKGLEGFKLKGIEYKGIERLVEEIKWHQDNNIWNVSKEALLANGNVKLNINYD